MPGSKVRNGHDTPLVEDPGVVQILPAKALYADQASLELAAAESEIQRFELPAFLARVITWAIGGLLLLALIWAAIACVDITAVGRGEIVPQGDVKAVQPAADGIVEGILVKEGQQVHAGDQLVLLDRTKYFEELNTQQRELEIVKAELSQLQLAEEALTEVTTNPDVLPARQVEVGNLSDVLGNVYSTYVAMSESKNDFAPGGGQFSEGIADIVSLKERLKQLIAEKASRQQSREERARQFSSEQASKAVELTSKTRELEDLHEQLTKLESVAEKTREQEKAYKQVYEEGAISRVDYFTVQKAREMDEHAVMAAKSKIRVTAHAVEMLKAAQAELRAQSRAELARLAAEIENLAAQIASVQMQIRESERHYKLATAAHATAMQKAQDNLQKQKVDMAQKLEKISQIKSAIRVAQRAFDQAVMCAPIAGTVTNIKVKGKGQVVVRGEALLTLVPANTPLVIHAYVPHKDIGFVAKGQRAKLKFDAFPFQDFGVVPGVVTEIEQHPRDDQSKESVYKVIISPERTWILARGQKVPFVSGMSVTAEIVTRTRAVLDYLLDPIRKLKESRWS